MRILTIDTHPQFGKSLYATNGIVELIISLSYGIRIGHFSLCGEQNVFFEQPADMTDLTTPQGWRHWGGHRFWVAPETEESYYPDNASISYAVEDESILLMQQEDPWLHVKKSIRILLGADASVQVVHRLENTGTEARTCSLWAITALAGGGTEHIPVRRNDSVYQPMYHISLWNDTDPSDPRVVYTPEEIRLTHTPDPREFKMGIHHPSGPVWYENNGVTFQKAFSIDPNTVYADNNVSFETFLCAHMVELESLSPLMTIPVGQTREHTEVWRLHRTV